MDGLAQNPYAAGAIILALIGAIITIIKLHDKRMEKIISDHQAENKEVRTQAADQTTKVIEAVKADAVSKEQLAKSIDELKLQNKENTDKLTEMFYQILRQQKPRRAKKKL